ncbi:hypothetical protein BKA24_001794 [Microbacterium marinum]|uniref:RuvC-like resolvase n=1 Tax=Microbacterium marinum TaxID=421115 RepID=A0A7W7FJ54_9MICO|nr:hypothetical protein [Microbacterium marinum]MBB4667085.1 hypothetical protein [Microbacterium marinum]
MTILLSLDPGGTTGYSVWHYGVVTPLNLIEHGQIPGGLDGFVSWARGFQTRQHIDEIVAEDFVDDGRTVSPDVTPLLIKGAVIDRWSDSDVQITWQLNTYKAHADDILLKRVGFWFVGQEHARDSARHAIAYLKVRDHRPTMKRIWPPKPRTRTAAA